MLQLCYVSNKYLTVYYVSLKKKEKGKSPHNFLIICSYNLPFCMFIPPGHTHYSNILGNNHLFFTLLNFIKWFSTWKFKSYSENQNTLITPPPRKSITGWIHMYVNRRTGQRITDHEMNKKLKNNPHYTHPYSNEITIEHETWTYIKSRLD